MTQPSPQFVQDLETRLRASYRGLYAKEPWSLKQFFKIFIPALSGALAVLAFLFNVYWKPIDLTAIRAVAVDTGNDIAAVADFEGGAPEEDIINDFEGNEINQIEREVTLALASY